MIPLYPALIAEGLLDYVRPRVGGGLAPVPGCEVGQVWSSQRDRYEGAWPLGPQDRRDHR
jgi:hypothetical protein